MEPFAEAIRSNVHIAGLKVGAVDHKVGLYADDVLLCLTDPLHCISEVSQVITDISNASYYKVNNTKSHMLGVHISKKLKTKHSPFSWAAGDRITYLGIQMTYPTIRILKFNYDLLLDKISSLCKSYQKSYVSLAGRIAAVKMLLLLIFCTFSVHVPFWMPYGYLLKLQNTLNRLIWNAKKARF